MARIPTPRSYPQIVGDMITAFLSRYGLRNIKVGSPTLAIMEAAAQSDARSSQDILNLLNADSLDNATGVALDRIGKDEDLERIAESPASGAVTISDKSFAKIVSKIYQGQAAPIVGSNKLHVADASSFPSSGKVYVGRSTANYEGPLNYISKTDSGTHWTLQLSDTTRRYHNLGESVVVAQGGNRVVDAGTLVQTPQGNTTDAVQFTTLFSATIPDGETEIVGVQVSARRPGVGGNVSAGAINGFVTLPFVGANVSNPLPFTNGQAAEDDKSYRERIRAVRQSRSKGTPLAIRTAVFGKTAADENKRILSSSLVKRKGQGSTLYIDDGTGYEEKSRGIALEPLADRASGGQDFFQVAAPGPVAKAFVLTINSAPFQLAAGQKLAVKVGGVTYEHTFTAEEFRAISNATAYEVAASINSDSTIAFGAATADSGTRVRIFAKTDTLEDIEVVSPSGVDANAALLFPKGRVDTMRLYKNDRLLSKDGKIAIVTSRPPSAWGAFVSGETLEIAVDGTAPVTYTFTDQDFINAKTGYTTVGRNSVAAWAAVFNYKIPGITAQESSGLLTLTSNVGTKARAKIEIVGGTLVTPGLMFLAETVIGSDRDYTLDRNMGQIQLEAPLVAGDSLSAGTVHTRAFIESSALAPLTVPAPGGRLWFCIDGDARVIQTSINASSSITLTIQGSSSWGERIRLATGSAAFANVRAGDYSIIWDSNLAVMQGIWRIAQASSNYIEIERASGTLGSPTTVTLASSGLVVVRASAPIQEVSVPSGSLLTARNFAEIIDGQLQGAGAKSFRTNKIRVNTYSFGMGSIALVAVDTGGAQARLPVSDAVENSSDHLASVQSGNTQAGTPLFTAPTTDSQTSTTIEIVSVAGETRSHHFLVGLKSFNDDYSVASPVLRHGHSLGWISPLSEALSSGGMYVTPREPMPELFAGDRVYIASPFSIGPKDDLTVVVDQDVVSKRYTVPMYRRLKPVGAVYGTQNTFRDADNTNQSLAVAFGLDYDFNDFAVYMHARGKTDEADATKRILWRYTRLGPDGNNARLRFAYPSSPAQALQVSTNALSTRYTNISVVLPSGALKTGYTLRNTTKIGLATTAGPGGLSILSYCLGFSIASATRDARLSFINRLDPFSDGDTITGASSGATATVETLSDDGTQGVLRITNITGIFSPGEQITGGISGDAQVNAQYNQVDLNLTLPQTTTGALANINNHGLTNGLAVYVSSSNPAFPSGSKTITEVSTTGPLTNVISYVESGSETTATNIGAISFDVGEASFTGANPTPIAAGDILRVETTASLPTAYENRTMRIGYFGAQIIQGYIEGAGGTPGTTASWSTLGDTASFKIFGLDLAQASATSIASAVNALAATTATCPVTATSTGLGTISKASYESALTADTWVQLKDGVNYVKATTPPANVAGDYQLLFKDSVEPSLTSDSDWTNEEVRLVPLTTTNITNWLSTLTVTGLSTSCSIQAADRAQRVQISSLTPGSAGSVQVQGGLANEGAASVAGSAYSISDSSSVLSGVTVPAADAEGMFAGMWVAVENTVAMPKSVIASTTTLTSIDQNGVFVLDASANTPVWRYSTSAPLLNATWEVERQGRYICFSHDLSKGVLEPDVLDGATEGDWVRIVSCSTPTADRAQISSVNQGIFRVVRVIDSSVSGTNTLAFWIENPNGMEEAVEADVAFFAFDSLMPGDQFSISTDAWGSGNKGTWTVESVGAVGGTGPQFVNSSAGRHTFKVAVSGSKITASAGPAAALGAIQYRLIQVTEGAPGKLIKQIRAISPNQVDGAFVDVKFESVAGYGLINATAGSILKPLDKLAFASDIAKGLDGYRYNTGLIAEANRILYGDRSDSATYPGVAAAGASIHISGPLVKRVTCALNLRVRSGVSTTDVADRVRSAVASVINKVGIGQSIAISDLIKAASKVNGVIAVSMVSPSYSAESDLIAVQPYEKPLVLSLEQDILVSFAGE